MAKKCLVVDDVEVSRFTNRVIVEGLGFDVAEADGVASCLAAVEKARYDLVILDWHLRRESALGLIQKIKDMPGRSGTAFIVCSGVENADAAEEAKKAGAAAFIAKPTTREKIEAELKKLAMV